MVLWNPDDWWGGLPVRWAAADIDKRETLEETAIVERLRRFRVLDNSHTGILSTGHAIGNSGGDNCEQTI
jgi:hypothetical protein